MRSRYILGLLLLANVPALAVTKMFLHNQPSMVSGYKLDSLTTLAKNTSGSKVTWPANTGTSITASTASGTQIQWTDKSSGNAFKYISPPLASGVTISGTVTFNIWGKVSSTSCNCGLEIKVVRYTGGAEGSTVIDNSRGVAETTTMAAQNWTGTPTSTAFGAGDRIVIYGFMANVGTMGGGFTGLVDYDGGTSAADGDSYVQFTEALTFSAEPEIVQEAVTNLSSASSSTVSLTNATTAGNALIAVVEGQINTNKLNSVVATHDSLTTITAAHSTVNLASPCASTTGFGDIAAKYNITGGDTSFTWTLNASATDAEIWLYEVANISGQDTGANAVKVLNNQTSATTSLAGSAVTTTGADDLVFAGTYLTSQAQSVNYPARWGLTITNGNAAQQMGGVPATYTPTTISNNTNDCFAYSEVAFWQTAPAHGCTITLTGAGPC